jgi:hypothetical protein
VRRREPFLVAVVAAAVYLLTLTGNHGEAEDGVRYAIDVRDGTPEALSNSAHLAYGWLNWSVYNGLRALGYGGGPLGTMQVVNALLGGMGLGLLWALVRDAVPGRTAAFGACATLGAGFGYWFYSGEAEVYVLSSVLLIAALALAVRAALDPSVARFALLGLAMGAAVLGHNTNVLFAVVALAVLFVARRELSPRAALTRLAACAGAAAAVVVPAYALAAWAQGLHGSEVTDWLAGLSQSDSLGEWGNVSASAVPKAAIGAGRALVGGHFLFGIVPRDVAADLLPGKLLREEYFMTRGWPSGAAVALLVPAALVLAGVLVGLAGWLRRPRLAGAQRALVVLCVAWLCAYVPFFAWWEPANAEFWISAWVPGAILVALGIVHATGRRAPVAIAVFAGALFAVNLAGSLLPLHRSSDDYWRVRLAWYERNATGRDLVVVDGYIWSRYLVYGTPAEVLDVDPILYRGTAAVVDAIRYRTATLRPRRVLVSDNVLHPGSGPYSECSEVHSRCATAAALRAAILPHARPLARTSLETVWLVSGASVGRPAPNPAPG